jgi:hypothetical protein
VPAGVEDRLDQRREVVELGPEQPVGLDHQAVLPAVLVVGDERAAGVQGGEEVVPDVRERPQPRDLGLDGPAGGAQPGQIRLTDDGNERLVGHASPRGARRRSTRTYVRTSSRRATTTTARHCGSIGPAWQRSGAGGDPAATLT